jgi:hypothetical protein
MAGAAGEWPSTPMPLLRLLLAAAAALLLLPAPAHARPIVGIGDQNAEMFADPNFRTLGVRIARIVVPYDAVLRGGWERDRIDAWMAAAAASAIEPLVAFNHSRYAGPGPSVAAYRSHIQAFHRRYPQVRLITPWNEANHRLQPTAKDPRLAADFYNQALSVFPGARIVAADVLDQPGVRDWLRVFRTYAYRHPQLWGLHNYGDANRFRASGSSITAQVLRFLPGELWLTETGGIVNFASSFPYDEQRAARGVRQTFTLAEMSPRITRIYLYNWYGVADRTRWDSGFVSASGAPRPALGVLRQYLAG